MASCLGIDRKVLGKRPYPKFEMSWSKWLVPSHQEFRTMSQWARLGLLDSQRRIFVERACLLRIIGISEFCRRCQILTRAFAENRGAHHCRHREFDAVRMRLVVLRRGSLGTRECWNMWQAPYWDGKGFQLTEVGLEMKMRRPRANGAFMVSRPGG